MTAEFPLIVTLADAAQGRAISVEADAGARAAIARRLGLVALDRFVLTADVRAIAGGIAATGCNEGSRVRGSAQPVGEQTRPEERRGERERVSTGRYRWSPYRKKKK